MAERSFPSQAKRGFQVIMTREDDIALTALLREHFPNLEIIAVAHDKRELRVLGSLGDERGLPTVFIMDPDPGEQWLDRLQTALLFSDDTCRGRMLFRNALPRRQALYHRTDHVYSSAGQPGPFRETMHEGTFHFVYDREDREAHRFTNKMFRLLSKMLVSKFAVVDAETRQFVRESDVTHMLKVGPDALESCRRHPNRYLGREISRAGDVEYLCLAPLSPERYEELRRRRRKSVTAPPPAAPAAPTG
ncbi:MAG: hypothetical protein BroJett029_23860 [Alphaproteobacteria bacterium]|nr:MAG: hypothetical protein BroJett029_23860 [Alphaproteobacteria bacterium]